MGERLSKVRGRLTWWRMSAADRRFVLLSVMAENGEGYFAYDLARVLHSGAKVYWTLWELIDAGLVDRKWTTYDGRDRAVYIVTPYGRRALRDGYGG